MTAPLILFGAARAITPLAHDLRGTVAAMLAGQCALRPAPFRGNGPEVPVARITDPPRAEGARRADHLVHAVVEGTMAGLRRDIRRDPRTAWIVATTKGDILALEEGNPADARLPVWGERIAGVLGLPTPPIILSSACISGTLAIKHGADLIALGLVDHVLLIGFDMASDLVLSGFLALHAISRSPCRPFDNERDGISLGEAVVSAVLTRDPDLLQEPLGNYLGGGMGNDANHISGPSRTGEGLVRAVNAAFRSSGLGAECIHHVNAHGTGSVYNDNMEAIAMQRLGLGGVPINSYKGYFGHTLGAAGLLECAVALEALRGGRLLRNLGARDTSAYPWLDVPLDHRTTAGDTLLKTSSGFGGCNAAIILRAWKG